MRIVAAVALIGIVILAAVSLLLKVVLSGGQPEVPLAAPIGVTFQSTRTTTIYADARGMTLYTFDKDTDSAKSACADDCARAWPPLMAPASGRPFGAWSIVRRENADLQWALNGKPLYTSTKDTQIGDTKGEGAEQSWHVAVLRPMAAAELPYGISVEESFQGVGWVLVNAEGRALYTFDGDLAKDQIDCRATRCGGRFIPLAAPEMASPVGDVSVISRPDATRQWAYREFPLYSFSGDVEGGDANGRALDPRYRLALVARYFTPTDVVILPDQRLGGVIATNKGMTLYIRDRFRRTVGGHNTRAGSRGVPADGRMVGLSGCDANCEQIWHPFLAPADAQTAGYWSVVARPDGAKQWAYRGYPLYTYVNDRKPGDMTGHDIFDYGLSVAANPAAGGAPALYWHVAVP